MSADGNMIVEDEAFWRRFAQVYDEVLNVLPYRNLLRELVMRSQIKDNMRLVDACCGTGNLLLALNSEDVKCEVTGIDYSGDMLAKAGPKVQSYKGTAKIVKADLDDDVKTWALDGKYDRFIFNNSLCLLQEPSQVLKKMATVAADGAVLIASTPRPNPNINELLEDHLKLSENAGISREDALQRMLPKLQPLLECNEQLMKRYGDSYHLPTEPQLRGWFKDSGWDLTELTIAYAGQNWLISATKTA